MQLTSTVKHPNLLLLCIKLYVMHDLIYQYQYRLGLLMLLKANKLAAATSHGLFNTISADHFDFKM